MGLHCRVHFLDSVPPLLWRAGQGAIPDRGRPNYGPTEPAGSRGRGEIGKVPQGGSARDRGPELLYSILGWPGIQAPSPIWTAGGSASNGSQQHAPGLARINRKTLEEQEATRYETPVDSEKQSIDEELGIQDVTDINEGWYPPPESESASAVKNLLDSQQPMEVDEAPEERSYQMFDEEALDVLGPDPGPGSPVTATKDIVLDTAGRFSRGPGDGRPITGSGAGSSGRRITGHTTEG